MTTDNLPNLTTAMTRKNPSRILLALLLAATSTAAFAAKSHKSPLPKDPAALLALAARHNGLASPNLKPWHIVATYQTYDFKGKPTQKGLFQEWWAAPNKYRLSFSTPGHALTIYMTPKGSYLSGDKEMLFPEFQLVNGLLHPVPGNLNPKATGLIRKTEKSGKMKFDCVEVITHHSIAVSRIYCLSTEHPILSFVEDQDGGGTLYRSDIQFQGRYLGSNWLITEHRVPTLKVRLLSAELLTQSDNSLFDLPPEAKGHLHTFSASTNGIPTTTLGRKIGGRVPVYPPAAKMEHQRGTVKMKALIGEDGKIHKLKVVSSPSTTLSSSALDAVKTWRYTPYKLAGIPVPVETTINITYSLDGRT